MGGLIWIDRIWGLRICSAHDVFDRVVISFDHSSHVRKTQVKIYRQKWGQKVFGHYKIQSCTQKRINFLVFNSQACFKDIINMHATSPAVSLFQNIISASLLSKNSGNESFSGINWMRDFSYSNSRENDFEKHGQARHAGALAVCDKCRVLACIHPILQSKIKTCRLWYFRSKQSS